MDKLKKKIKNKENIIKLILVINLILMLIGFILLIIKQSMANSPSFYWIRIIILFALNILLIVKTNINNYRINVILMICLIIVNIVVPIFYSVTYQNYKEYQKNNVEILKSDGGLYMVEKYSDIYGVDIYKINHK